MLENKLEEYTNTQINTFRYIYTIQEMLLMKCGVSFDSQGRNIRL
jgi:hypothetical protein